MSLLRYWRRMALDWIYVVVIVLTFGATLFIVTYLTGHTDGTQIRYYLTDTSDLAKSTKFELSRFESEPRSTVPRVKHKDNKMTDKMVQDIDREYQANYQQVERTVEERMAKVRRHCTANNWTIDYRKFTSYHFPLQNIVWCPSFKAGSSTWRDFFIDKTYSNPFGRPNELHMLDWYWLLPDDYVNNTYPREPKYYGHFKNSFLQIRHPIDRLLSLYESTCIYNGEYHESMFWWGIETIIRFRKVPYHLRDKTQMFAHELRMWAAMNRDGMKPKPTSKDNPFTRPPHPHLGELVNYIIWKNSTEHWYDGHWYPVTEWCDVCQNNFTYITKSENKLEMWYLLDKLGLKRNRKFFLHKHNPSNNIVRTVFNSSKPRYDYLDYLSNYQRLWLKEFFKDDFKIFDYDDSMLK